MKEYVVLVDEKNNPVGTMEKNLVHSDHTPLHRGFSVFLFNAKKELLLQQRGHLKKTWPLTWSNSCCGHPASKESIITAAKRRLHFELGITHATITTILPHYRYRYKQQGVVENEICPVMIATTIQVAKPNPDEVESIKWFSWQNWLKEIKTHPDVYSEWSIEETTLLNKNKKFIKFLKS